MAAMSTLGAARRGARRATGSIGGGYGGGYGPSQRNRQFIAEEAEKQRTATAGQQEKAQQSSIVQQREAGYQAWLDKATARPGGVSPEMIQRARRAFGLGGIDEKKEVVPPQDRGKTAAGLAKRRAMYEGRYIPDVGILSPEDAREYRRASQARKQQGRVEESRRRLEEGGPGPRIRVGDIELTGSATRFGDINAGVPVELTEEEKEQRRQYERLKATQQAKWGVNERQQILDEERAQAQPALDMARGLEREAIDRSYYPGRGGTPEGAAGFLSDPNRYGEGYSERLGAIAPTERDRIRRASVMYGEAAERGGGIAGAEAELEAARQRQRAVEDSLAREELMQGLGPDVDRAALAQRASPELQRILGAEGDPEFERSMRMLNRLPIDPTGEASRKYAESLYGREALRGPGGEPLMLTVGGKSKPMDPGVEGRMERVIRGMGYDDPRAPIAMPKVTPIEPGQPAAEGPLAMPEKRKTAIELAQDAEYQDEQIAKAVGSDSVIQGGIQTGAVGADFVGKVADLIAAKGPGVVRAIMSLIPENAPPEQRAAITQAITAATQQAGAAGAQGGAPVGAGGGNLQSGVQAFIDTKLDRFGREGPGSGKLTPSDFGYAKKVAEGLLAPNGDAQRWITQQAFTKKRAGVQKDEGIRQIADEIQRVVVQQVYEWYKNHPDNAEEGAMAGDERLWKGQSEEIGDEIRRIAIQIAARIWGKA
jgi:hypothetical protein